MEDREISIPEEADLTLLCLDYLRDLRRAYSPSALLNSEGIHADYLTVACWALNRAIDTATTNDEGNDCWKEHETDIARNKLSHTNANALPSLAEMEDEILSAADPNDTSTSFNSQGQPSHSFLTRKNNKHQNKNFNYNPRSYEWYEYDDEHPSNQQRFYPLQGLASGPELPGPLTLGEMVTASLVALNARTRRQAELELEQSDLFEQYIAAVQDQGFFDFPSANSPEERQALYEERYNKVLAKFRLKLAQQALEDANPMEGYLAALTAAEHQRARREEKRLMALEDFDEKNPKDGAASDVGSNVGTEVSVASYVKRMSFAAKLFPTSGNSNTTQEASTTAAYTESAQVPSSMVNSSTYAPDDLEEAEKLKNQGNTYMQQKDYDAAASCYTKALKLSPAGPQSHVYFSNRAAALVSLRQFDKAILDSERSLSLQPTYAKAHARLGLAHFLMGNYEAARDAYEVALEYEPHNKSNQTYLEKAKKRLAEQQHDQPNGGIIDGHHHAAKIALVPSPSSKKKEYNSHDASSARLKEAEKFKAKGNALMSSRDYEKALDAYSQALNISSDGPQSHVYYSNRAAALCYLERYQEAEQDSLQSLELDPTYGKAHARLGLSRFFLQDYAGAVSAYQTALEHDPDNAASQSYLVKAKAKLAKQEKDDPAAAAADKRRHKMDTGKSPNPKIMKMANSHSSASTKTTPSKQKPLSVDTASPTKKEDMDITARRLLHDENLRTMATKAMANPSKDLLSDPEMHAKAKKAMAAMRK